MPAARVARSLEAGRRLNARRAIGDSKDSPVTQGSALISRDGFANRSSRRPRSARLQSEKPMSNQPASIEFERKSGIPRGIKRLPTDEMINAPRREPSFWLQSLLR